MNLKLILGFVITLGAVACSDDPVDGVADGGTVTQPDGGGGTATCDPSAGSEAVQLLNAPVDPGVAVVKKTPQHPGSPGPAGLP